MPSSSSSSMDGSSMLPDLVRLDPLGDITIGRGLPSSCNHYVSEIKADRDVSIESAKKEVLKSLLTLTDFWTNGSFTLTDIEFHSEIDNKLMHFF